MAMFVNCVILRKFVKENINLLPIDTVQSENAHIMENGSIENESVNEESINVSSSRIKSESTQ